MSMELAENEDAFLRIEAVWNFASCLCLSLTVVASTDKLRLSLKKVNLKRKGGESNDKSRTRQLHRQRLQSLQGDRRKSSQRHDTQHCKVLAQKRQDYFDRLWDILPCQTQGKNRTQPANWRPDQHQAAPRAPLQSRQASQGLGCVIFQGEEVLEKRPRGSYPSRPFSLLYYQRFILLFPAPGL